MPAYEIAILAAGWVLWFAPFLRMKRPGAPATLDKRARWGMILQGISYAVIWFGRFWWRIHEPWRVGVSVVFLLMGDLLTWTASRALGRQWRIDAGLNPDHELVRSGPYSIIRHPIYAAMLCLLLGTGFLFTPLPQLAVALVIFIIGTEIRVRVEDRLLAARFGDHFNRYQRSVPAYIPLLR